MSQGQELFTKSPELLVLQGLVSLSPPGLTVPNIRGGTIDSILLMCNLSGEIVRQLFHNSFACKKVVKNECLYFYQSVTYEVQPCRLQVLCLTVTWDYTSHHNLYFFIDSDH